ncbi:MAG: nucleoside triphosphate pyrophosphatase [Pseudomonadota bacterium]
MTKLILASASPRRQQLLAQIGVTPDGISPADIDETPHSGEAPRPYVRRMGLEKARAVHVDGQFTVAGDTVVALGQRILPKAETDDEVAACLELLSGRAHQVMTSVVVCGPDGKVAERLSSTRVQVKRLSQPEVKAYLQSQEGIGKAGGYAIQGRFGAYIKQISGSYTGVMGLPVYETAQLLNGLGYRL